MKQLLRYCSILIVIFSLFLPSCTGDKKEEKKGTINEMTDNAAKAAVEKINKPIDKAKDVKKMEDKRLEEMNRQLEDE